MIVRWFGQSAFLLTGSKRVLIDPFGALGERRPTAHTSVREDVAKQQAARLTVPRDAFSLRLECDALALLLYG